MNIKFIYILICIGLLAGLNSCKSCLKFSALPEQEMSPSEEIKYIHQTDQRDRRQILLKALMLSGNKIYEDEKILAISDRDSIRLTRIMKMKEQGLVKTDPDQYYAAYTYFHGGGINMTNDTMHFRIAYEMFKYLGENSSDKKWKKRGEYYTPLAYNRWQEELKGDE